MSWDYKPNLYALIGSEVIPDIAYQKLLILEDYGGILSDFILRKTLEINLDDVVGTTYPDYKNSENWLKFFYSLKKIHSEEGLIWYSQFFTSNAQKLIMVLV